MKRGLFLTFEGAEGTGKTTQALLLARALKARGVRVLLTKEPGGTDLGRTFRRVLLSYKTKNLSSTTELLLMLADRAQHVHEVIRPALAKGITVISDRYADATLAYQGYGRGFSIAELRKLNHLATCGLRPDLTLLMDMPAEVGLRRAKRVKKVLSQKGKGDRFEQEKLSFHRKIRNGYLALARKEPRRFKVISLQGKSISDIQETVRQITKHRIPCRSKRKN